MTLKFVVVVFLLIGLGIAVAEGLPKQAWEWFSGTEAATKIFSIAGTEEKLPGPLRGLLEENPNSRLDVNGILQATNAQREAQGLVPLHLNSKLSKAAEVKVDDMFAHQYFEHESPDGKSPADIIRMQSYEFIIVGENLALGNFKNNTALVQAWMDSPGHRANILNNKFQEIGIYAKKGTYEGKEIWLAVQEFGSPLSSCPGPSKNLKPQIDANRDSLATKQAELKRQKEALDANRYGSEDEYNAAVTRYNNLVKETNDISEQTQELVREYNNAVVEFNKCLESNT
jgi:hypothetical protein